MYFTTELHSITLIYGIVLHYSSAVNRTSKLQIKGGQHMKRRPAPCQQELASTRPPAKLHGKAQATAAHAGLPRVRVLSGTPKLTQLGLRQTLTWMPS